MREEIKNIRVGHTDCIVDFHIAFTDRFSWPSKRKFDESFEKKLKLIKTISLNNMVLFGFNGKQKKYTNVIKILKEFFLVRLFMYGRRKEALIISIKKHLKRYFRFKIFIF